MMFKYLVVASMLGMSVASHAISKTDSWDKIRAELKTSEVMRMQTDDAIFNRHQLSAYDVCDRKYQLTYTRQLQTNGTHSPKLKETKVPTLTHSYQVPLCQNRQE